MEARTKIKIQWKPLGMEDEGIINDYYRMEPVRT